MTKAEISLYGKMLAVAITTVTGAGFVTSSSAPNERVAVLETEVKTMKEVMPDIVQALHRIDKKQDSILIVISMGQK